MNFESQNKNESSDKNPFENAENIVTGAVDFIMSAKVENGDTEEESMEEAGRIGFARMFLEDFSASDEIKEEILKRVGERVREEREEGRSHMAKNMGITGEEGQGKARKEEQGWRKQLGA